MFYTYLLCQLVACSAYSDLIINRANIEVNMSQTEKNDMSDAEKEICRNEVRDFLGEEWLEADGENPVQIAWKRKDHFAKTEIVVLGKCLNVLKENHHKWILDNVPTIKSKELNNAHGAIFEVLLAGYQKMVEKEHNSFEVIPARQHQQGYDVSLKFEDGFIENVSIKWLASSHHNDVFHGKMKILESKIKETIKKYPHYGFNICVLLSKYPHSTQDWSKLENKTIKLFKELNPFNALYIDDFINVKINIMTHHRHMKLYQGMQSYSFMAASPYHKNEENNILAKIQKSAYTTNEKSPQSSNHIRNTCFIRVPTFVDPEYCRSICIKNKDLMEYNNLHSILFYCAAIGTNLKESNSFITHYISPFITNIGQLLATKKIHLPGLCFPVGVTSEKYHPLQLVNEHGAPLPLINHYVYQNGKCFIDCLNYKMGETVPLDSAPDGIEIYQMVQVPGGSIGIAAYKGTGELFVL